MAEVKAKLQGVFNRGFRDGWKSGLKKAKIPRSAKWFLRDKTPLPFPEAGLKNSDAEDEDDEDEIEEVGGEQDNALDPSALVPEDALDPSAPAPKDIPNPSAPTLVDPAYQFEN